ncbi:protein adenylyltransferase SelO-like isoform X1 [Prionailurus iriomotensis]
MSIFSSVFFGILSRSILQLKKQVTPHLLLLGPRTSKLAAHLDLG